MAVNLSNEQVKTVLRLRWRIWGIMIVCIFFVFVHRVSMGVVSDQLMAAFSIKNAAALGGLSAMYFYIYAIMQIPAGVLADAFGPRKIATAGMLSAGLGSLLFGLSPSLNVIYVARFMVSLGVAVIYVNLVKIMTEWFRGSEFGTMQGLVGFVGNLGAVIGATPLAIIVSNAGWRFSFELVGVISLLIGAGCWLIIKDKPADLGLPSIREIEQQEEGIQTVETKQEQIKIGKIIRLTFSNFYTWPPFLAYMGMYGVQMALIGMWGVPYLMQIYGLSRAAAANYMLMASLGAMLGSPCAGYLSDKLRTRKKPYLLGVFLYTFLCLILTFWNGGKPPLQVLFPVFFLMGVFCSTGGMTVACAKEANPVFAAGISSGTANMGAFVGSSIMQPLFGYALDLRWQGEIVNGVKIYPLEAYYLAFLLCCFAMLVSLVGTLLIKETHCRNIYEQLQVAKKKHDNELTTSHSI